MTKFLYCFQGLLAKFLTEQERKLVRAAMSKKIPSDSVPLDPELYLKKYHVMTYVEDAISFLLERKDEDPKTKPFELLAEYFKSVRDGTHVLFREYAFISVTPHNCASFVKAFWQSYAEVASRGGLMKVMEYLSLLRLLCYDFPAEMVQKVAQVVFSHSALQNVISFPDFMYTFQVLFCYKDFLNHCERLFSSISKGQPHHLSLGSTVVVSIPSFAEQDSTSNRSETASENIMSEHSSCSPECTKQVDTEVFAKAVTYLIQRHQEREPWLSCPSVEAVKVVLSEMPKLSFYDFILALSRSEHVNAELGILPPRMELLSGSFLPLSSSQVPKARFSTP